MSLQLDDVLPEKEEAEIRKRMRDVYKCNREQIDWYIHKVKTVRAETRERERIAAELDTSFN